MKRKMLVMLVTAMLLALPHANGQSLFGSWANDDDGMPCFDVNPDQNYNLTQQAYFTHQVGNDRLVAMTTSGTVSIRQDEGGPKLLDDFEASAGQWRGGIGYLINRASGTILCTHQPSTSTNANPDGQSNETNFTQRFGIGYYEKTTSDENVTVKETIMAPFGDTPFVFVDVEIAGVSQSQAKDFTYALYFGGRAIQLRQGTNHSGFASQYATTTIPVDYSGGTASGGERYAKGVLQMHRPTGADQHHPNENKPHHRGRSKGLDDEQPRPTFLLQISDVDVPFQYTSSATTFMGNSGNAPFSPSMLVKRRGLDNSTESTPGTAASVLAANLSAGPGSSESTRLFFVYGYLPEARFNDVSDAITHLANVLQDVLHGTGLFGQLTSVKHASAQAWKQNQLFNFTVPGMDWVSREVAWHSYNLRAMMSFDDYYESHIINQAGEYLYNRDGGFQGAARDPLAHGMPFTYSKSPQYYREILQYTLKEIRLCPGNGTCLIDEHGLRCAGQSATSEMQPCPCGIPWGLYAIGEDYRTDANYFPSDLEQWTLLGISEYVLATRDVTFLNTTVTFESGQTMTVLDSSWLLYQRFVHVIGFGEHGMCRLLFSDHNDGFLGQIGISNITIPASKGESVMNSAMAIRILDRYTQLLSIPGVGELQKAREVQSQRESLIQATQHAAYDSTAGWYLRAWLGNDQLGWIGRGGLWLEPNSWALLSGLSDTFNVSDTVLENIEKHNRQPSPTGAIFSTDVILDGRLYSGTWYCGSWVLVMALAKQGQMDTAVDEWVKNSLQRHTSQYPEQYAGVWSGPDVYQSVLGKSPGLAGPSYALHNAWSHTFPLITLPYLAGFEAGPDAVMFRAIGRLQEYSVECHLFSFSKEQLTMPQGGDGDKTIKYSTKYTVTLRYSRQQPRDLPSTLVIVLPIADNTAVAQSHPEAARRDTRNVRTSCPTSLIGRIAGEDLQSRPQDSDSLVCVRLKDIFNNGTHSVSVLTA